MIYLFLFFTFLISKRDFWYFKFIFILLVRKASIKIINKLLFDFYNKLFLFKKNNKYFH